MTVEIVKPDNWHEMSYGEQLIWLAEKQREIIREFEGRAV